MAAAARVGDRDSKGHVKVTGSPDVIINDRRAARRGDRDSKGHVITQGSPTVEIN